MQMFGLVVLYRLAFWISKAFRFQLLNEDRYESPGCSESKREPAAQLG